jgi:surfeit locus 1 family protein
VTGRRGLIIPAIMTLVAFAVLIGLGSWQLQRRDWKLGLIERIEARAHGQPITLAEAKQRWRRSGDVEYSRVRATGHFLHPLEIHLYGLIDGEAGWKILTPFETTDGDVIFVDRGFVPEPFRDPASRPAGPVEGEIELTGLARAAGAPGWFTPANQPGANRWFWRDLSTMTATLPVDAAVKTAPFMLEAEKMGVPGGWPRSGGTLLSLPNRHLEYALTWFGLAAALLAVFAAYATRHLRARPPGRYDASIADGDGAV